MSRLHPPDDDDDANAFRQALHKAGVRRLYTNRADPGRSRRQDPSAAQRRAAAVAVDNGEQASRTSDGRVTPVRPSEFLDFALPDLPYRTYSQLKRGQIAWEAGLDLHGYSLDEARQELESFLKEAAGNRWRCVLVVHGKAWGSSADYPVIKSHVNTWLREWPAVLAFCSSRDSDGGTGAVYVLLRRKGRAD
ncbi:MAG TPA: Smr/MutS family protein [Candidatus Halomonas stercoripullorum]|uniref:Smr/MutS family protein n=1 Tax=Candidatus Halomonas stercoripullorum TaxID=2838617 RepID=A0A9D1WPA5_9GAMM|nr:Smr/MutS family protein [Candidatus Halomonas stercoripullorum]